MQPKPGILFIYALFYPEINFKKTIYIGAILNKVDLSPPNALNRGNNNFPGKIFQCSGFSVG